ncbi:MAG TPA: hypothetical protein VKA31_05450 [Mariprofundaceae bacterium]|nr:hypothetical protein [Mariprofundaceae bacterium]
MKKLGFLICMAGSVAAVLVPPYKLVAGLGDPLWAFILNDIVAGFGQHIHVYDHIDVQTLLMELIAINAIGIAMMLFARR